MENITAQSFRENFKKERNELSALIDKHYEALWAIAKEFQKSKEPFRVQTIYGDFNFVPDFKFSYKKAD